MRKQVKKPISHPGYFIKRKTERIKKRREPQIQEKTPLCKTIKKKEKTTESRGTGKRKKT